MADHEYNCNGCGKPTRRSMLTVKKVLFTGMGPGAKTDRARVIAWLCPPCIKQDEDWNREARLQPSERAQIVRSEVLGRISEHLA